MKHLALVSLIVFLCTSAFAHARGHRRHFRPQAASVPGCQQAKQVRKLWRRHGGAGSQFRGLMQTVCRTVAGRGATVYYPNRRIATYSWGQMGATLYYPNGRVATFSAGQQSATWYYPNGKVATFGFQSGTWYYPNGRVMSWSGRAAVATRSPGCEQAKYILSLYSRGTRGHRGRARNSSGLIGMMCRGKHKLGSTVYYPNGRIATYSFGKASATWYYPSGQLATYAAGSSSATWYYPSGQLATYGYSTGAWYYPNGQIMRY